MEEIEHVLIGSNFHAIFRGAGFGASEGEFLLFPSEPKLTRGQLEEIAKENKVELIGRTVAEQHAALYTTLAASKAVPLRIGPTDSEKVLQIVKDGNEKGLDNDTVLIRIVQAGIKFSHAQTYLKNAQVALGLVRSPAELAEIAKQALQELRDELNLREPDGVATAVRAVRKALGEDATDAQAMTQLRRFAKEREIKLPSLPRGRKAGFGTGGGWAGFFTPAYDMLVQADSLPTDEEIMDWVTQMHGKVKNFEKRKRSIVKRISVARELVRRARG